MWLDPPDTEMPPDHWTFPFGHLLILDGSGTFLWAELLPPPNSYVGALTPEPQNVTVFGDRVFKVIIKLK